MNRTSAWADPPQHGPIRLVDVTKSSRITFQHTDGGAGNRYIVESVVAGLALFDFDGDGLIDVYFLNGGTLRANEPTRHPRTRIQVSFGIRPCP